MDDVTTQVIRLTEMVKQESLRTDRIVAEMKENREKHESYRDQIREEITEMKIELKVAIGRWGLIGTIALVAVQVILKWAKF